MTQMVKSLVILSDQRCLRESWGCLLYKKKYMKESREVLSTKRRYLGNIFFKIYKYLKLCHIERDGAYFV